MYMDKSRLDRKSGNATQSVEALHQLASSYFVDRDGTMRRLHEIQISTGAIKVQRESVLRFSSQQNHDRDNLNADNQPSQLHTGVCHFPTTQHSDRYHQIISYKMSLFIRVALPTELLIYFPMFIAELTTMLSIYVKQMLLWTTICLQMNTQACFSLSHAHVHQHCSQKHQRCWKYLYLYWPGSRFSHM